MTTVQFQEVTARRRRTGTCPVCGKRVTRSRSFTHTVNPFNRNVDGTVRTAAEVRAAVDEVADAWVPDFRHERCSES